MDKDGLYFPAAILLILLTLGMIYFVPQKIRQKEAERQQIIKKNKEKKLTEEKALKEQHFRTLKEEKKKILSDCVTKAHADFLEDGRTNTIKTTGGICWPSEAVWEVARKTMQETTEACHEEYRSFVERE